MVYKPAISTKTFASIAQKWLQIVRFNESGLILNFVGDHFYTIPQIISDKTLLRQNLGKYYKRYILIYLQAEMSMSSNNLRELLLKEVVNNNMKIVHADTLSFSELIDAIILQRYEIAFFISRIEDLFTIKHPMLTELDIIARNHRISFLYFTETNLTHEQFYDQQKSYSSMFQNVIFMPIYQEEDAYAFIRYNEKLWHLSLPEDYKVHIIEECGGSLWLARQAIRYFRNNPYSKKEELTSHPEFLTKAIISWNQLFPDEQEVIRQVIVNKEQPGFKQAFDYLCTIGMLRRDRIGYTLGIPAYKKIIQRHEKVKELTLKDTAILYDGQILNTYLSKKEVRLLLLFLNKKNQFISRQEVAEELWQTDDYSDWALDKLVSRIRKFLVTLGLPKDIIKTKKGEGYVFG